MIAHPDFLDQLLGIADAAMYQAKRAGGDRVEQRRLEATHRPNA